MFLLYSARLATVTKVAATDLSLEAMVRLLFLFNSQPYLGLLLLFLSIYVFDPEIYGLSESKLTF